MTYEEFQKRYQYDIATGRLGGGGFGEVFKAYDTHRDRWVAIKIAKVLPEQESVRLKREVALVSKLPTHPNIAYYEECYTFREGSGEYDYGILQYYEEGNLLQLLRRGALTTEQKQSLLRQILSGLEFLHDNGIIHRDLKPQNILVVKRGNEYIPKITDFGISKKLDVNKSSVYSNSLVGAGTLAYSSPEQLGSRAIRKNTDLWSFGVIAFQLLTDALPFTTGAHDATSEAGRRELFEQINSGRLPDTIRAISEPWRSLVRACLVQEPEQRIQSVRACLGVLNGDAEETTVEPPVSPPPAPPTPPKPAPTRTPLWIALGCLVVAAVVAAWLLLGRGGEPASTVVQPDTLAIAHAILGNKDTVVAPEPIPQPQEPAPATPPPATLAQLSAPVVNAVTETGAKVSATVTHSGNGTISEQGVCYSTNANPTISNPALRASNRGGSFSVTLSDLRDNTTYYIRAYAVNEAGVAYSAQKSFKTAATPAQPAPTPVEPAPATPTGISIEMVYVEGGSFTMGCTGEQGSDCWDNEKPAHQVTLSSYRIGKYPVTQKQWRQVMGSNPSYFSGCDNCPVENVSWNDVQEFIRKLNAQTGKSYRLPTEAEWEFAARGGNKSRGYKYSGSNTLGNVAWYEGNSGSKTHPVGQKAANELGIYDMSGNVWEWCSDWYGAYGSSSQTNPKGPSTGSGRVLRGGSWDGSARSCRVSYRDSLTPGIRINSSGFRLALPL